MRPRLPHSHSHAETSTGRAGFAPALSGVTGQFLDGTGNWTGASGLLGSSTTNVYLNGNLVFSEPPGDEVVIWMGL